MTYFFMKHVTITEIVNALDCCMFQSFSNWSFAFPTTLQVHLIVDSTSGSETKLGPIELRSWYHMVFNLDPR